MDHFELDKELHETLAGIRQSVRQLFEQLRLKDEKGDISGKDRLERVPALAKRNFGHLTGPVPLLAFREAWRLIDFLEGTEAARLSPLARDALRTVELDRKLAALRGSDRWKDAAARLREALEVAGEGAQGEDFPGSRRASAEKLLPGKLLQRIGSLAAGLAIPVALAVLTALWLDGIPDYPRTACLALERASIAALKRHWDVIPTSPMPVPRRGGARPHSVVFTISDPAGGPVRSIWTTSRFSFAEGTSARGPGGGKADVRLRVGGWGDTYVSLLQFPIPDNRLVRRATIRLKVLGDHGSRPTTMTLRAVNEPWPVPPGAQHRLWWRDCPDSEAVRRHLPAPGPRDSTYEIDITQIYNEWASGLHVNHGILLEPEHIGSYGRSPSVYATFSTFYSTRALDPANRPKLILTY